MLRAWKLALRIFSRLKKLYYCKMLLLVLSPEMRKARESRLICRFWKRVWVK